MADKNPFINVKFGGTSPPEPVDFTYDGIKARATFNTSNREGYLSRGTLAIIDPQTGHLLQKDPNAKNHLFKNSVHLELNIPKPASGQSEADITQITVNETMRRLRKKYGSRVNTYWKNFNNLKKMTLFQAFSAYGEDYLADRTSSINMRNTYRNRLNKIAHWIPDKPISEITRKDLKKFCEQNTSKNSVDIIQETDQFLKATANRLGVSAPTEVFEKYCDSQRKSRKEEHKKQIEKVTHIDVLPIEYEKKLDKKCWQEINDPMWVCTMMIKETGLPTEKICQLKIGDFNIDNNSEKVFCLYRRDDLMSATNDYTFPVSLVGGAYIKAYISHLKNEYGESRVHSAAYFVSHDDSGKTRLNSKEINSFIYNKVGLFLFGFVGKVKFENNFTLSITAELLRATREKHLREDCKFQDDLGALTFMLHRSMVNQVQSDHYRSFTDPTGREYLFNMLRSDRHGLRDESPAHKQVKKLSRAVFDAERKIDEVRIPSSTSEPNDQITIVTIKGIKAGDIIEIFADKGCFAKIVR